MKADLSRNTFQPFKHFTRVLTQQGRVQLDADLNEQASILLHYLRSLAADLIGPAGGTKGAFNISPLSISPAIRSDFQIAPGHYYVDGILCEAASTSIKIFALTSPPAPGVVRVESWSLDGVDLEDAAYSPNGSDLYLELYDDSISPALGPQPIKITKFDQVRTQITSPDLATFPSTPNPRLRRIITYLHQPGFIFSDVSNPPIPPALPSTGSVQVFLDVWERLITYLEDDTIREVALGGPDTAARTQVIWQVRVMPSSDCMSPQQLTDKFQWGNRGQLKAMAKQNSVSTVPCIVSPNSSYSRPENQLYRVEINRGGAAWDGTEASKSQAITDGATFKWSRENGSVAFAIASGGGTNRPVLESLGRDARFGLPEHTWVEVQDDRSVLSNNPGQLLQVQSVDRSSLAVTLSGTPGPNVGADQGLHPLLRRWDQQSGDPEEGGPTLANDNAALVIESSDGTAWLTLEDGIQIQFQQANPFVPPVIQSDPANIDRTRMNVYRTGDYWLIPARTATGDVEWPKLTDAEGKLVTDDDGNVIPLALPPQGVTHRYAPLAVLDTGSGNVTSCQLVIAPPVKKPT